MKPPNSRSAQSGTKVLDFCKLLRSQELGCLRLDASSGCLFDQGIELSLREDGISLQAPSVSLERVLGLKSLQNEIQRKLLLSYLLAKAAWQFYDSDWMAEAWSKHEVQFMRQRLGNLQNKAILNYRPFILVEFQDDAPRTPSLQGRNAMGETVRRTHIFPKILALGITLLEIELGEGIEKRYPREFLDADGRPRANADHLTAGDFISSEEWKGRNKTMKFVKQAIEICVKPDTGLLGTDPVHVRENLHRYVVTPLRNLFDMMYDCGGCPENFDPGPMNFEPSDLDNNAFVPCVSMQEKIGTSSHSVQVVEHPLLMPVVTASSHQFQQPEAVMDGDYELQQFWREKHTLSSFHCGDKTNTQEYLADLQKIAGHIHRCRRSAKITKPIRVAILDSGCKKDLAFFQDPERSKRIKGWKDFTVSHSDVETDSFGHGTFMARLLMHVAPIVDVYLIRVADNTDALQDSQDSIAKAIEHAGLDPNWNVDIISMSFGYFDESGMSYTIIEEAIERVKKVRKDKILFLASAGNSWSRRREDFPASHKDVIPIYAGDPNGVFLTSNPTHTGKKLGTYGKDIPSSIVDEVKKHFRNADLNAGTSIATAIAAGIVAMMLSYAAALPSLMKINGFEEVFAKLFTKKGMEHMLESMSLTRNDKEYFISPISYWGNKKKDMDLLISICSAIEQMNKQPPE
ncbi:S8 family peptidase [Curvularia clavata]|uniref:S8 family peptidase n=1 Tax=Curvularia clavata TaxID=95742 RepID=A0A9Q9DQJ2_CURCL|nr:S8 family peptidase [Curvularia clavata]